MTQEIDAKKRACFDDKCQCRNTCKLWVERDSFGHDVKSMTWKTHYICFSEPCSYHQPTAQGNPHDLGDPGPR